MSLLVPIFHLLPLLTLRAVRVKELEPLVEEYRRLRQLAKRLGIDAGDETPRRVLAKPGQRREQVLELVAAQPGVTIREMSRAMGVDPTSLYRPCASSRRRGDPQGGTAAASTMSI
jgi:hypothetical protein